MKLNVIEDQYLRLNFENSQGFCLIRGSKINFRLKRFEQKFLIFSRRKKELYQKAIGPLIGKLFFLRQHPAAYFFLLVPKNHAGWRVSTSGYWF